MKYKITVKDQVYEVEIENINARPIVAVVDGERFEVTPESGGQAGDGKAMPSKPVEKKSFNPNQPSLGSKASNQALTGDTQTAPLPGTVVEIFVKAGDKVEAGQVILIIEAMKMKNSIRSLFSGAISEVLVSAGQSVAHKQPLIKFTDLSETAWM
ncbi:acetyl-CoA carboxylase biotin carboxyl carrier protein [Anaerolineales bacterium]|nr:acetyl-CoA carboxylase biotin carboxyl carrier protein [Anaerolineales bacterium]